jgi:hypothetical protein
VIIRCGRSRIWIPALTIFLAAAAGAMPVESASGVVQRIAVADTAAGLEIHITAVGFFDSKLFLLPDPNRIVLDVSGVSENAAAPETMIGRAGLRSIRASQFTADVVRIVIDFDGVVPTYKFSRTAAGFLFVFPASSPAAPAFPEIRREDRTPVSPDKTETVSLPAIPAVRADVPKTAPEKNAAPVPAVPTQPTKTRPAPAAPERKISTRLTACADLALFRDAGLAAVYGRPADYGGRIDIGFWEFGELWAGVDFLSRTAADVSSGGSRRLRLIPIEAGVKFRMSRGVFAPYVGFGAAYFFFHEETSAGALDVQAFGLISTAGWLVRLGKSVVLDAYVRYRRLPVDLAAREFDAGGFHFGGGIGLEF